MINLKIPGWAKASILILTGLLILSLIRGCNNQKEASLAQVNAKNRINKLEKDSANNAADKIDYETKSAFRDGQLELSNNKLLSLTENLDSANDRVATLLKKHIPVKPNTDTTVTTVGNDFIEECASCFTELKNGQQLVLKYKAEKDNQDRLLNGQITAGKIRIGNLEKYNNQLITDYKSLLGSVGKPSEIRRTLYLKGGLMAINNRLPNAIGGGFVYQDKLKRLYSVGYYNGKYGAIYQAEIAFPLSLRKRQK